MTDLLKELKRRLALEKVEVVNVWDLKTQWEIEATDIALKTSTLVKLGVEEIGLNTDRNFLLYIPKHSHGGVK